MFFDDPKNALSVARTHQQDLLRVEQRDRLARQAVPPNSGLSSRWKYVRAVGWWLKARLAMRAAVPVRKMHQLPDSGVAGSASPRSPITS